MPHAILTSSTTLSQHVKSPWSNGLDIHCKLTLVWICASVQLVLHVVKQTIKLVLGWPGKLQHVIIGTNRYRVFQKLVLIESCQFFVTTFSINWGREFIEIAGTSNFNYFLLDTSVLIFAQNVHTRVFPNLLLFSDFCHYLSRRQQIRPDFWNTL